MLFLLSALIVGVGSAGATDVTYTISTKNTLSVTGTAPANSSATMVETYSASRQMTSGNEQTLTLSGYNGYRITSLTLSMKSNQKGGAGKLSYSTDDGANFTYIVGDLSNGAAFNTGSWYGSWSTTYVNVTFSDLNIECGASNVIFKIRATTNSLYCQSYTITYEKIGPADLTSFSFANATPAVQLSKNGSVYEASYTQTATATPATYDGSISYSIDYENSDYTDDEADINAETGEVTILLDDNTAGSLVVKAAASATSKFNAANTSYTLSVTAAPVGVGTPTFDVATGSYYYGKVVKIASTNADRIYYTTDGTTPSNVNGTLYDKASGVVINKTMTLKAIGYDGETASEVGSVAYTLLAPEVPTFSVTAGGVEEGTALELTIGEGGVKVVYTTDGTSPTVSSAEYSSAIEIDRPMTIKAVTVDAGNNLSDVTSSTYTIVVKKNVVLWAEDFSEYSDDDVPSGGTYSYECTNSTKIYGTGTAYAGGALPELLVNGSFSATIPLNDIVGTLVLTYKNNNGNLSVSSSTTGVVLSGDTSADKDKDINIVTVSGVKADMTSLVLNFTSTKNTRLDNISLTFNATLNTEAVTVSSAGLATYASDFDLDFTDVEGLEAYIAKENGSKIVLEQVEKVPAGEGMLLRATNGGTNFNVPLATSTDDTTGNIFVRGTGAAVASQGDASYNYILNKVDGVVGFYRAAGHTVATNRAYLATTIANARIALDFNEEATAISDFFGRKDKVEKTNAKLIFNVNGQRVVAPQKGLYIINGKKVVVK